jgi:hypothetical protein
MQTSHPALSPGVMWPEREASHLPLSSAKVKLQLHSSICLHGVVLLYLFIRPQLPWRKMHLSKNVPSSCPCNMHLRKTYSASVFPWQRIVTCKPIVKLQQLCNQTSQQEPLLGNSPGGAFPRAGVTFRWPQFRVTVLRRENLEAEAGNSSGIQGKGNVPRWKPSQ